MEYLEKLASQLKELVPEVRFDVAHCQMSPVQLEKVTEESGILKPVLLMCF